ncbi:serine hydrolase [Actinopolymorpha sp. B11F2]|uniref:serine hydrolase n=1 Tax=Actinopolymorpha sp. B11F2 TaxID=3160862 RepID=UPI0032E4B458
MPHLCALGAELAAVPGTVSVWCGHPGAGPAYSLNADHTHYAASTMKVAVMIAAYQLAETGELDLDAEVAVHDEFVSAAGRGATYRSTADYDSDPEPWRFLGRTAPLRWLVRRMIVRSSNLATNLALERVGPEPVAAAWRAADARHAVVTRGIQDEPAQQAGLANLVTASDLAGLMGALALGAEARTRWGHVSPAGCREMLDVLRAQEITEDVVRGLPPGTPVAHKNGWVDGIRHSVALVHPPDAPAYLLVSCTTAPLSHDDGCALAARVAAASWADRFSL